MVGDAGGPVRSVYELRTAYDAAARLWADGSVVSMLVLIAR